ncbi:cytochrome ubiquinol oxidase subunit II [Pseudoruegeria sp. SK021]|uniref:cytochrome ubiquinol oxidase subunit II n=1 Tax=Pseudoruegeria sp. SK021 TaxID=1933035 RepID=UPI001F0A5F2C|nr:cytochrome ubiquinol oxidase subunit II [Pseudoruegeria sp. SK021]
MIAVAPVLIFVPLILWRFRYRNQRARYLPDWEYSAPLEIVMWGVPAAIIVALSTMLWHSTKALDPYRPLVSDQPPLNVQVVGLDWKWLFLYPEQGIATVGELAFPAGRPVALTLTSDTVMQSFLISALAGQIYVMPGMTTKLQLLADAPGRFEGENTQFNGTGFVHQKFPAIAMTDTDFDAWVNSVKSDGIVLDDSSYGVLAAPSTEAEAHQILATSSMPDNALYFSPTQPDLFSAITHRYHQGRPIPPNAQPGSAAFAPPRAEDTPKPAAETETPQ